MSIIVLPVITYGVAFPYVYFAMFLLGNMFYVIIWLFRFVLLHPLFLKNRILHFKTFTTKVSCLLFSVCDSQIIENNSFLRYDSFSNLTLHHVTILSFCISSLFLLSTLRLLKFSSSIDVNTFCSVYAIPNDTQTRITLTLRWKLIAKHCVFWTC